MGTRERHIGHATARSAPVADLRGGRLFAMPRFLVGISHGVYRHRVFVIAGAITALFLMLLAVLPALFASDPKLSNTVPAYSEVSEEVVDALVHSSSLPLLVAAIAFSIWGVLAYLRCLDYVLRRRLVAIAAICALWMIEVILKYKSFTPFYATVLWYLYYVPMTLIPLLYQLCGLRLAGLEQHRLGRRYCAALWIVAILLIGFVLTNDFHQQVFHFDRTSDTWSNDYTYGWGYFAVLVWTAFNFVAFFILVGRSSSFRIQRFSGTAALVLLGGAFFAVSYALRVPWAWRLNFSLVYCVLCVVAMEICLDCGVIPSYHDIAGIFDTLPLDLKVLTRDLQEVYATPASKPMPVGVRRSTATSMPLLWRPIPMWCTAPFHCWADRPCLPKTCRSSTNSIANWRSVAWSCSVKTSCSPPTTTLRRTWQIKRPRPCWSKTWTKHLPARSKGCTTC